MKSRFFPVVIAFALFLGCATTQVTTKQEPTPKPETLQPDEATTSAPLDTLEDITTDTPPTPNEPVLSPKRVFSISASDIKDYSDRPKATQSDFPESDASNSTFEEFIKKYQPDSLTFHALRTLAQNEIEQKNYVQAVDYYFEYGKMFPEFEKWIQTTVDILEKPQDNLEIRDLGNNINTEMSEYLPVISYDNQQLLFRRKVGISAEQKEAVRKEMNAKLLADGLDPYNEFTKILVNGIIDAKFGTNGMAFFSEKDENGNWAQAEKFPHPINIDNNSQGPHSLSADNQTLVLFGNYDCPFERGNLYYSNKTATGWEEPTYYPAPINTDNFETGLQLTSDGLTAIFTSDRKGTVGRYLEKDNQYGSDYWGNVDIFVSQKEGDKWTEPINLGETINTPFCEYTPFLHPDGKTLYFSSSGHPGLGGLDVFVSKRLSDTTWTEWSEPINLGKTINTAGDEWGYKINTDGDLAYFSSERSDGKGKSDIYTVDVPQEYRPDQVVTVTGQVTDENGKPVAADIEWVDLETHKIVGKLKSDIQTGEYFIALPEGKKYSYYADKENYFAASNYVDLTQAPETLKYKNDIVLKSLKQETQTFDLKILFEFGKADLKDESIPELNRVLKMTRKHDTFNISLTGHTDNVGSNEANLQLSKERAQTVASYLVSNGIDKERISVSGKGETLPVASNETEAGRSSNRRVELVLDQNN